MAGIAALHLFSCCPGYARDAAWPPLRFAARGAPRRLTLGSPLLWDGARVPTAVGGDAALLGSARCETREPEGEAGRPAVDPSSDPPPAPAAQRQHPPRCARRSLVVSPAHPELSEGERAVSLLVELRAGSCADATFRAWPAGATTSAAVDAGWQAQRRAAARRPNASAGSSSEGHRFKAEYLAAAHGWLHEPGCTEYI